MTPHEVRAVLVDRWVSKAEEDHRIAAHLMEDAESYSSGIAFHSQQCAEKWIKALLTEHQVEFPKTHTLRVLTKLLSAPEPELAQELVSAAALNPYGAAVRYPDDLKVPTSEEVQQAFNLATMVREKCKMGLEQKRWSDSS